MEIYLVRHTETVCAKGICYGQADVDIVTPHDAIFEKISVQLPENGIIYSSPLQRCLKLSNYIASQKKTQSLTVDNRLMEMNFGDWELQNWDEINPEHLNPWMEDFVSVRVPNGESFEDLHQRVVDFIENEIKFKNDTNIIIVAHAGIIRSILCHVNGIALKDAFQNNVAFGEVIQITLLATNSL